MGLIPDRSIRLRGASNAVSGNLTIVGGNVTGMTTADGGVAVNSEADSGISSLRIVGGIATGITTTVTNGVRELELVRPVMGRLVLGI
jgi:hypothetical protein